MNLAIRGGHKAIVAFLDEKFHMNNMRKYWACSRSTLQSTLSSTSCALSLGKFLAQQRSVNQAITPLISAIGRGKRSLVEFRIQQGDDVNQSINDPTSKWHNFTPLCVAAALGYADIIDLLCDMEPK